jgi:hypothetical protein
VLWEVGQCTVCKLGINSAYPGLNKRGCRVTSVIMGSPCWNHVQTRLEILRQLNMQYYFQMTLVWSELSCRRSPALLPRPPSLMSALWRLS